MVWKTNFQAAVTVAATEVKLIGGCTSLVGGGVGSQIQEGGGECSPRCTVFC